MAETSSVDGFFDADGLLSELPGGTVLCYDQARRLDRAKLPGAGAATAAYFQYDTTGQRTRKAEPEGTAAARETLYIDDQTIETVAPDTVELQLRAGNRLLSLVRMQAPTDKPVQITCRYPLNSRTGSVSAELGGRHAVALRRILSLRRHLPCGHFWHQGPVPISVERKSAG